MTDNEYASRIYCAALEKEDDGDIYVRGVLDMIGTLTEREQLALEYRYRNELTYIQTGRMLGGVCGERARQIIQRALRKLRQPSRLGQMRISAIVEKNNTLQKLLKEKINLINEKNAVIEKLSSQTGYIAEEEVRRDESDIQKNKIEDIDFSTRTYNALKKAGIHDYDTLLAFSCFDDIMRIPNFGKITILEIARRMRDYGYTAWVDWATAMTSKGLRTFLQEALK